MRVAALLLVAWLIAGCDRQPPIEPVAEVAPPPPAAAPAPEATPEPAVVTKSDPRIPRDAYRYQRDLIRNARVVWGLTAPIATFAGQIHQESSWRSDARSRVGASGLAQFMPATATWISGVYSDELGTNDVFNPAWAMRALVRYDRFLYDRVRVANSPCDRFLFALSAYNGGAGRVNQRQAQSAAPGNYGETSVINPGISAGNQRENADYPVKIIFRWQPLYIAAGWGIGACT